MKPVWIVLLAAFLYVALLAFAAGAFSYSLSPATEPMPFGAVEFWLNRYQTLAVSVFAILGLVGVWLQLGTMRKQTSAALQQAHKADFTALAMARSSMHRLRNHADFSKDFRLANALVGATTPPPTFDPDLLREVQRALATTSPNPLGIADLHESWKLACEQLSKGVIPLPDFLLYADSVIADCNNTSRTIDRVIEALHAQIEASV